MHSSLVYFSVQIGVNRHHDVVIIKVHERTYEVSRFRPGSICSLCMFGYQLGINDDIDIQLYAVV